MQLSWSCNKETLYERRVNVFKELVLAYTGPIMEIINSSESILTILSKSDQI